MLTHQQIHADLEYRQDELRRAAATSRARRRRAARRRGDDEALLIDLRGIRKRR